MGTRSKAPCWCMGVLCYHGKGPKEDLPRPPRVMLIERKRVQHNKHRRRKQS